MSDLNEIITQVLKSVGEEILCTERGTGFPDLVPSQVSQRSSLRAPTLLHFIVRCHVHLAWNVEGGVVMENHHRNYLLAQLVQMVESHIPGSE